MKCKCLFGILLVIFSNVVNAQFELTNPFGSVKKESAKNVRYRAVTTPTTLNTLKLNVSLPGYWYSNNQQQNAVVGLGLVLEHYKADSLIYGVGPYVWYNTPIPTGYNRLPVGYGLAFTYKSLLLVGLSTRDFYYWGPVIGLNFSFGNGNISL